MGLYKKITLLGIALSASMSAWAVSSYRAVYDVQVRGIGAGQIVHEAFFTNVSYRIDTVAHPSLAAKMLGFGEARESVKGLLKGFSVQPQSYRRSMEGKPEYALYYLYEPDNLQVQISAQGKEAKAHAYDKDLNPLDSLSMVAQSLIDIENSRMPTEHTLVIEDEINSYHVQKLADENWKDAAGKPMKVQVYRQTNGNKQTQIYFAENPLRLIRLEQLRKGERRFSMTLTDYQTLQ